MLSIWFDHCALWFIVVLACANQSLEIISSGPYFGVWQAQFST